MSFNVYLRHAYLWWGSSRSHLAKAGTSTRQGQRRYWRRAWSMEARNPERRRAQISWGRRRSIRRLEGRSPPRPAGRRTPETGPRSCGWGRRRKAWSRRRRHGPVRCRRRWGGIEWLGGRRRRGSWGGGGRWWRRSRRRREGRRGGASGWCGPGVGLLGGWAAFVAAAYPTTLSARIPFFLVGKKEAKVEKWSVDWNGEGKYNKRNDVGREEGIFGSFLWFVNFV